MGEEISIKIPKDLFDQLFILVDMFGNRKMRQIMDNAKNEYEEMQNKISDEERKSDGI